MLQEHDDRLRIIRARTILDMLGERPATGRDLFRPLKGLDNAALLVRGGRVLDVLPWKSVRVPVGTPVTDMGDVTLMPGSINAHCHLQLSHTAGRTLFGAGFTAWLRSLIALLREEHDGTALALACRKLVEEGYLGSTPIRHFVTGVSAGIVDEQALLDLQYSEDSRAQVDLNCVMNELGEIIELQGTGEGRAFTLTEQQELVRLCAKGNRELLKIQKEALGGTL